LIKQTVPTIGQTGMKAALSSTARDVVEGFCSPVQPLHGGLSAGPGDDDATGPGLVDAFSAVITAYFTNLMAGFAGVFAEAPVGPPSVTSLAAPITLPTLSGTAFSGGVAAGEPDPLSAYYQAYYQGFSDAISAYTYAKARAPYYSYAGAGGCGF
jgi:hypothetical protein